MKYYTVEGNKKSISKVFAIYYICMAVFCLIRISSAIDNLYPEGKIGDIVFSLIIQLGVLFLLPAILYCVLIKVKPRQALEHFNFSKVSINVILISIVIGLLCFVINIAVSSLFNGVLQFTGYRFRSGGGDGDFSIANFFLQIFLVAVLPAFCEEFLHRGILLQGIKHIGFKKAILISSIMFALLHFNIQQVFYAFVVGLVLGFVSVVSKNIWPSIIIHFVNNAIATYIDFADARGWVFGDIFDNLEKFFSSNPPVLVFSLVALFMLVVVVLLFLFIWLLYKQTIIRKVNKAINKAYDKFAGIGRNAPIHVSDEHEVIIDLLETSTLLNLDYKIKDNPIDMVMPKEKSRYKPRPIENLFLWGSIVMSALITLFTYVWGLF